MPKERRDRSDSFDRSRTSPFPCKSSRPLLKSPSENEEHVKEWDDARCPVCMEHPHNAILLMCSSHKKGCHPFMCDTSYRLSNCFDQFRKSFAETSPKVPQQEATPLSTAVIDSPDTVTPEVTISDYQHGQNEESGLMHANCENQVTTKLVCPLCRGDIYGWVVVEPARIFMNAKLRSCACENCDFSGTYSDLRKHARLVHPLVRPAEADADRQRNWRRLERQRDIGDLISNMEAFQEVTEDTAFSFDERDMLTVYFLIRVFEPDDLSWSISPRSTTSRTNITVTSRPARRLWGESYDRESRNQGDETSDGGSSSNPLQRQTQDDAS